MAASASRNGESVVDRGRLIRLIPFPISDIVVEKFRNLETSVLVTTDLLNRGFDVPEVSCVVNYDIPNIRGVSHHESYYHRTGRAGRSVGRHLHHSLIRVG